MARRHCVRKSAIEVKVVLLSSMECISEMALGLVGDDEEVQETTDRAWWEKRGSKATLEMTDTLFAMVKTLDTELELRYNKFYVGLYKQGKPNNFVIFRPKKDYLRIEVRLECSDELEEKLEESGLELMDYDSRWRRYRIRLAKTDIKKHEEFLQNLLKLAHDEAAK